MQGSSNTALGPLFTMSQNSLHLLHRAISFLWYFLRVEDCCCQRVADESRQGSARGMSTKRDWAAKILNVPRKPRVHRPMELPRFFSAHRLAQLSEKNCFVSRQPNSVAVKPKIIRWVDQHIYGVAKISWQTDWTTRPCNSLIGPYNSGLGHLDVWIT